MARRHLPLAANVLAALFASACAGTTVDPATADASLLPARELTAEEHARLASLVEESMVAVRRRRFDDAGRAATAALAIDARSARARAVWAMVLLQRAATVSPPDSFDANAGEFELQLARQLAPDDAFVGWIAAVFLAETGHLSAAAHAAEQTLAHAGAAPAAERAALAGIAGTCRYELGEERAAVPHLHAYVELHPDDAIAHFRLASCLLRIAALTSGGAAVPDAHAHAVAAAQAFERCAELSPGDEDVALAVATAHWRAAELAGDDGDGAIGQQHRQAAEQRLRAVAERFPASAEPWFRLGVAAEQRAAPEQARIAYGEAVRRAPHVGALLGLAALLDHDGDAAAAATLLRQALDADAARTVLTAAQRRAIRERLAAAGAGQAPRML